MLPLRGRSLLLGRVATIELRKVHAELIADDDLLSLQIQARDWFNCEELAGQIREYPDSDRRENLQRSAQERSAWGRARSVKVDSKRIRVTTILSSQAISGFSQSQIGDTLMVASGLLMRNAPQQTAMGSRLTGDSSLSLIVDFCARQHDLKARGQTLKASDALLDATLNAMPTHVAILDSAGRIILVNRSWRYFVGMPDRLFSDDFAGVEYLSSGILGVLSRRHAQLLRIALQSMLRGDVERFQHVIHTANSDRWYQISVARFQVGKQAESSTMRTSARSMRREALSEPFRSGFSTAGGTPTHCRRPARLDGAATVRDRTLSDVAAQIRSD